MNVIDNSLRIQSAGNTSAPKKTETEQAKPEVKKDGKKKILLGMAAVAALAAAGIAVGVKAGKANKAANAVKDITGQIGDDVTAATEGVKTVKVNNALETVKDIAGKTGDDAAAAAETVKTQFKAVRRFVSDEADKDARLKISDEAYSFYFKEKALSDKRHYLRCRDGLAAKHLDRLIENAEDAACNRPLTPCQTFNVKLIRLEKHIGEIDPKNTAPEKIQGLLKQAEAATGKPCKSVQQARTNIEDMMMKLKIPTKIDDCRIRCDEKLENFFAGMSQRDVSFKPSDVISYQARK